MWIGGGGGAFRLERLVELLPSSRLNRAPCFLRFRLTQLHTKSTTAMLFRSGYTIVTGIRHPTAIDAAVGSVLALLRTHVSTHIYAKSASVKTILATTHISRMLDPYTVCRTARESTQRSHILNAYWEPELCNAIILQCRPRPVTVKIFPRTGSVTVFGRNLDDMSYFFTHLMRNAII